MAGLLYCIALWLYFLFVLFIENVQPVQQGVPMILSFTSHCTSYNLVFSCRFIALVIGSSSPLTRLTSCMLWTRRAVKEESCVPVPVAKFLFKESVWTYRKSNGTTVARQPGGCSGRGVEGGVHKVQWVSHRGCHHGDLASECCGRRPGLQRKRSEPVASAAARELANTTTQQVLILAVVICALHAIIKSHHCSYR